MEYSKFLRIILKLQKQSRIMETLYDNKIDLVEFTDLYESIISELIIEIYGEVGYDWFCWFCYENDFGQGTLQAWDENEDLICYSHESLWKYLEEIRTQNNTPDIKKDSKKDIILGE